MNWILVIGGVMCSWTILSVLANERQARAIELEATRKVIQAEQAVAAAEEVHVVK